jgi:hypothetical protein
MHCLRDLQRRENQAAGRMEDEIKRNIIVRHLNGAQYFLGVIDVDVARHRKSEKSHRFLSMHEQNDARVSYTLQSSNLACTHRIHYSLLQHRLESREDKE